MAVTKTIEIDGKEVKFKASAAVPRLYRIKFGRDIYRDFTALQEGVKNENQDIESLELFENIAYIMARHADPDNVPTEPDEWLEQFGIFSIYEVLPKLIEPWGINLQTQVQAKKNIARLTEK